MIKIKIEDHEMQVPTDCSEIKLSSYIEFNIHHSKFIQAYNENIGKEYEASEAVKALAAVIEGFDEEVAMKLTVGDYIPSDKERTINSLLHLINSVITQYEVPELKESGYFFEYKGKKWVVPILRYYDGRINPNLKYGQYIEAMETIRVTNAGEVKTPNDEFSEYLRVLAAIVREEGCSREETELSLRMLTDSNMQFFNDINMKVGLDVYFFLNGTINI
jgi:hypothetical protein